MPMVSSRSRTLVCLSLVALALAAWLFVRGSPTQDFDASTAGSLPASPASQEAVHAPSVPAGEGVAPSPDAEREVATAPLRPAPESTARDEFDLFVRVLRAPE